jgi:hypothetical protein
MATQVGGQYNNNRAEDRALSPTLNLTACTGLQVKVYFYMWFDIEPNATCANDWADMQASSNNGTAWTTVTTTPGYTANNRWCGELGDPPANPTWNLYEANLSSFLSSQSRLSFRFHSNNATRDHGIYIDNISFDVQ